MRRTTLLAVALGAAVCGMVACSDSTTAPLVSDTELLQDVASSSGDVIASEIGYLESSETDAGLASSSAPAAAEGSSGEIVRDRSHTCYDADDVAQAECNDTTTAKVVFHFEVDGSRSGTFFSAATHRVRDGVISGLLGHETSRTHDAVGTALDSLTFTTSAGSRSSVESAVDSVRALVFDLPHSTNPWPVSGMIVRNLSGTLTVAGTNRNGTLTYTRRVEVDFPADAEGNVTLHVNANTCNLNLVTHAVTGCH